MKQLFIIVLFALTALSAANAQAYKSAVGLRLGYPTSITFKHFFSENAAFEVFAGFRRYNYYSWTNIAGLYEHHTPIESVEGLSWYVGGGASAFFWRFDDDLFGADGFSSTSIGLLGVGGLDFKFPSAPFNLSVDWMPLFFLGQDGYSTGFYGGYGALSARYAFGGDGDF